MKRTILTLHHLNRFHKKLIQEEKSKASARKRDGRKSENKNPENKNPEKKNTEKKKSTYYVKKGIKSVMPHGIVTLISSRRKEE